MLPWRLADLVPRPLDLSLAAAFVLSGIFIGALQHRKAVAAFHFGSSPCIQWWQPGIAFRSADAVESGAWVIRKYPGMSQVDQRAARARVSLPMFAPGAGQGSTELRMDRLGWPGLSIWRLEGNIALVADRWMMGPEWDGLVAIKIPFSTVLGSLMLPLVVRFMRANVARLQAAHRVNKGLCPNCEFPTGHAASPPSAECTSSHPSCVSELPIHPWRRYRDFLPSFLDVAVCVGIVISGIVMGTIFRGDKEVSSHVTRFGLVRWMAPSVASRSAEVVESALWRTQSVGFGTPEPTRPDLSACFGLPAFDVSAGKGKTSLRLDKLGWPGLSVWFLKGNTTLIHDPSLIGGQLSSGHGVYIQTSVLATLIALPFGFRLARVWLGLVARESSAKAASRGAERLSFRRCPECGLLLSH